MRFLVSSLAIVLATSAAAHAPVINKGQSPMTADAPYVVEDPEHSKAIFSELTGAPQFYQISSEVPFKFYTGITAPKLESCGLQQTFDLDVLDKDLKRIDGRKGNRAEWWPWYEEYGKTWYWVGPEIGKDFLSDRMYEAGTYYIKVSNASNSGKFALVVGDEEKFGFGTIAGMVLNNTMGKIRDGWWDEADCN